MLGHWWKRHFNKHKIYKRHFRRNKHNSERCFAIIQFFTRPKLNKFSYFFFFFYYLIWTFVHFSNYIILFSNFVSSVFHNQIYRKFHKALSLITAFKVNYHKARATPIKAFLVCPLKEQMLFKDQNMFAKIQQKIAEAKFEICSDLKTTAKRHLLHHFSPSYTLCLL